jgi:hypothetical protein
MIPIGVQDRMYHYAKQAGHSVETHFNSYSSGTVFPNPVSYHTGIWTSYIWQIFLGIITQNNHSERFLNMNAAENTAKYEEAIRKSQQRAKNLLKWEDDVKGILKLFFYFPIYNFI